MEHKLPTIKSLAAGLTVPMATLRGDAALNQIAGSIARGQHKAQEKPRGGRYGGA